MTCRVYIGLGSNLKDPTHQIQSALTELKDLAVDAKMDVSPFYNTQPIGPQNQPEFVNAVVGFDTQLPAQDLLEQLFKIEDAHGRVRQAQQWSARTLDLDLLLYGEALISSEQLVVPHPHMHERAFVLQPLIDVAADCLIPGRGLAADLLQQCDRSGITQQ